ncbi:MAG TPA: urea ABC transporter substrate-binding protein, partial [Mycobacterium sp.]|nr:urea ABC transporter substrate-binding protein [Mycobacterium sp.]
MRLPRGSSLKRSVLAAGSLVTATSLLLAGCGSKATETDAANAESCVDTSGS